MVKMTGKIRVTFVPHVPDPAAPTAEQLAAGIDVTDHLVFTRDARHLPPPSQWYQPLPRRFEVARWPDGRTTVRELYYAACAECEHRWPTPEALVADYRQVLEGMGLDDWGITAERITACPHCAHDL